MSCACCSPWWRQRECIERAGGCVEMPLGEMQVDRGFFKVAMSEQHLDGAQVGAGFKQMRGEAMAQSVGMDMPVLKASPFCGILQALQRTLVLIGQLAVCQRPPGNNHFLGLCREVAPIGSQGFEQLGLSITSRSLAPCLPEYGRPSVDCRCR